MKTEFENTEEPKKIIDEVNQKVWNLRGEPKTDFDAMSLCAEALSKAKEINYPFGIAQSLINFGMGNFIINNNAPLALQQMSEGLEIFKELDNKKWTTNAQFTIAIINNTVGNSEKALYSALRGLEYYENNNEEGKDKTMAYYVLGTIYKDLKKYDEAEKYFKIGISNPDSVNNTWGGRIYLGLAAIYMDQENYEAAIAINLQGLEILKSDYNSIGESRALNDLGIIYKKQKKYTEALNFFLAALKIREENNITRFVITSYVEIAALHTEMGNYDEALEYLFKGEEMAIKINFAVKLAQVYFETGNIYKTKEDFKLALFYYEKLMKLNEEIHLKDTEGKINKLTQELVKEKEAEIERIKNVELKSAYDIIELKNKEILDSIRYAKRIQNSLMTSEKYIDKNLNRLQKDKNA